MSRTDLLTSPSARRSGVAVAVPVDSFRSALPALVAAIEVEILLLVLILVVLISAGCAGRIG